MPYTFEDLAERERRRSTKENAHLYMCPDADRLMRPDAERFFHPDWKRSNPYFQERKPGCLSSAARAYANAPVTGHASGFGHAPAPVPKSGPSPSELLKLKSDLAALKVNLAVIRHANAIRNARGLPPLTESDPGWQIFLKSLAHYKEGCRKAGFNPGQPRVPVGNPDGGQWTSEGGSGGGGINDPRVLSDARPDNQGISGAQYAQNEPSSRRRDRAEGHHFVPRAVYKARNFYPETSKVFDDAKTGCLHVVGNRWDAPHRVYNEAVKDLLDLFLSTNGIQEQQMTPDQARSFLKEVTESNDPRIRNFNMKIRFREFLYRLRTGIRRGE